MSNAANMPSIVCINTDRGVAVLAAVYFAWFGFGFYFSHHQRRRINTS